MLNECTNCGSNDLEIKDGYQICKFCGTKYIIPKEKVQDNSKIELSEDILRLFKKIEENPEKADRYARLILEIDPSNIEAKKYIKSTSFWW